jgi:hypothetical protein
LNPQASKEAAARAAAAFAEPVEGPSHRPGTRIIAVVVVIVIVAWGARLLWQHGTPPTATLLAAAAVLLLLVWPLPGMLTGRTRIDATGISQQGWSSREVRWDQIQRARFTRIALTPRLVVSTGIGRFKVFYSGSRELDAAFEHAVDVLTGAARR